MKFLVLAVGLPRSGKTTWASAQGDPVVCPDEIRKVLHGRDFYPPAEPMVWYLTEVFIRALFGSGHDVVILDATNITEKRRRQWVSTDWTTVVKVFATGPEVCRQRAKDAGRMDLVDAINRMEMEADPIDHSLYTEIQSMSELEL